MLQKAEPATLENPPLTLYNSHIMNSRPPDRHPISRRQMLGLSAGALLSLGLWPGALSAQDKAASGDFHFAVINDIHFINEKCAAFLERVLAKIKSGPQPDFCLLAGDLSHHGNEQELGTVKEIFGRLGIPFYAVPGNHDYLTQNDRSGYDKVFANRLNYSFEHKGWQFIAFDSTEGLRADKTSIHEPAVRFLMEASKKISKTEPLISFTHFPLGETVKMRPKNAEDVLEMFVDHNLQATFGGHFHGFTQRSFEHATLVTNHCCSFSQPNHDGTTDKGFFLCQAKDGRVSRSFVEVSTAGI